MFICHSSTRGKDKFSGWRKKTNQPLKAVFWNKQKSVLEERLEDLNFREGWFVFKILLISNAKHINGSNHFTLSLVNKKDQGLFPDVGESWCSMNHSHMATESGGCTWTACWKQPLTLPWELTAGSHARSPPKDDSMTLYAFRSRDLHCLVYSYRCNKEVYKSVCYHCYRTISYVHN